MACLSEIRKSHKRKNKAFDVPMGKPLKTLGRSFVQCEDRFTLNRALKQHQSPENIGKIEDVLRGCSVRMICSIWEDRFALNK